MVHAFRPFSAAAPHRIRLAANVADAASTYEERSLHAGRNFQKFSRGVSRARYFKLMTL
jgi:hypothetical protein